MKKKFNFLAIYPALFFLFVSSYLFAEPSLPPKMSLKANSELFIEHEPIECTLSIIHAQNQKISEADIDVTFPILSIQKLGEEIINPKNIYSEKEVIYCSQFGLKVSDMKAGFHTIGPIRLHLQNYIFESNSVTIHVQAPVFSPLFELTGTILKNKHDHIYPGQTCFFEYILKYEIPLKITREILPLLQPEGFITDGKPLIEERTNPSRHIIRQKARAYTPGCYDMGLSTIEGKLFLKNGTYRLYRAVAPSFSVTIDPFPELGKPTTFYGAIGSFSWRSRLLSFSPEIYIGNSIDIEYRASGRGDLSTVQFPPKEAFLGLEKSYIFEKWPLNGEIEGNTKTFHLRLKPRRTGVFSIPSIVISSFDPVSQKYLSSRTRSFSITIQGASNEQETERKQIEGINNGIEGITPIPITLESIKKAYWTGSQTAIIFLFFIVLGIVEWSFHRYFVMKKNSRISQKILSDKLYEESIKEQQSPKKSLLLFRKALFLQLFELSILSFESEEIKDIRGTEPIFEEIRDFIRKIDQILYSQESRLLPEDISQLFSDGLLLRYSLKSRAHIFKQEKKK